MDVIPFTTPRSKKTWIQLPAAVPPKYPVLELDCDGQCITYYPWLVCHELHLPSPRNFIMGFVPIFRYNLQSGAHEMEEYPFSPLDVVTCICYDPWSALLYSCSVQEGELRISSARRDGVQEQHDVCGFVHEGILRPMHINCLMVINAHFFLLCLTTSLKILRRQHNKFTVWQSLPHPMGSTVAVSQQPSNPFIAITDGGDPDGQHRSLNIFDLCGRKVAAIKGCPPFVDFAFDENRLFLVMPGRVCGLLYSFPRKLGESRLCHEQTRKRRLLSTK